MVRILSAFHFGRLAWWRILCTIGILLLLVVESGGSPPVQGRLRKSLVRLGEQVQLEIVVEGTTEAEVRAQAPRVSGLRITGPQTSRSSQTSIINGRVESSVTSTLTFQITAVKEGSYTIPGIPVTVNGKKHSVGPFRLRVERSPQSNMMLLRADVEKRRVFLQEPVTYRISWYIATDVEDYVFTIPVLEAGEVFRMEAVAPPKDARSVMLALNSLRIPASVGTETLDGLDYAVYRVSLRLYPLRQGEITLEAPFIRASVREGWTVERDFFGFTRRVPKVKILAAAAEASVLHVNPLPVEGRPRGFSGAVGSCTFAVDADQTDVRVGDPIRLTMIVRGRGLLDQIARYDLSSFQEVTRDFAVVETLEPGEVSKDKVVFEQVVRARSDTVEAFPAIPFSYFDTRRGRYESAWSKPVPLHVTAAPKLGAMEEYGVTAGEGRKPAETTAGLRALFTGPELYASTPDPRRSLGWLLLAPGGYAFLLLVVTLRAKFGSGNAGWKRRRTMLGSGKAFAKMRKLADKSGEEFFTGLTEICSEQVSIRLGVGKGEVTVHDLPKLVARGLLSQDTGTQLREFLEELDALRFSPYSGDAASRHALLDKAKSLMPKVKK